MHAYILLGILGLGSAAAYALLSSGLVLIYRASGVLNFAQGAFAMVGAYLFFELRVNNGWPYIPAVIATVVILGIVGALLYLVLLRPLRDASVVVRVIATLGVLLVLEAVVTLRYAGSIDFVPESLPLAPIRIAGVSFPQDRLWLMGIAIVLIVVLHVVWTYTRFGLATRAVAENERSAAAHGWSPTTIATVNWAVGTGLAALAGILIVPLTSLSVSALTLLVIPALSVALFGGFSSFPLALVGAIIVGVVQGLLTKYQTNLPGLSDLVPLALVVIVLVLRRHALPGRGELMHKLPSLGSGRAHPAVAPVAFVIGVLGALFLPLGWSVALGVSVVAGVIVLSVVVVTGYAGQLSLGQYALAGLGALIAAQLVVNQGWPFPAALVCGVLGAAVLGVLFGLPSLRSRGAALAIVTLSVGVAVNDVIFNTSKWAGGQLGFQVNHLTFFGLNLNPISHPRTYTIFCLCWFALAVAVAVNLRRSGVGRRLISIRANERAAASLGINVATAKLYAFTVSAALAGLGGVLLAFGATSIVLSQGYDSVASMTSVSLGVVGGVGYIRGAVLGGQLATGGLPAGVIANYVGGSNGPVWLSLIGSVLVLVTLRLNPNGIAGSPLPSILRRLQRVASQDAAARPDNAAVPVDRHATTTLSMRGLTVAFGGVKALTGVDLAITSGQVLGLIGPNGAGKTTLVDAVTGYVPASGTVLLGERRIDGLRPHNRARQGISRCFQSLELFDDITVEENLRTASEDWNRWAYLRGLLPSHRRGLAPAAQLAVDEFRLRDDLDKMPKELSYGKRKLVAIARSAATAPSFLLLDEPAAGLSEQESMELGRLIRRLADDWNIGILIIEHDVNLIMSVSDRVAVLEFGSKIAEGTPREVETDPRVVAAYLGEDKDKKDSTGDRQKEVAAAATEQGNSAMGSRRSGGPVAVANGLYAGYNAGPVLRDIDIAIHPGQVVALLGPNGAGKTTTVLSLAGALTPMQGSAAFGGEQATSLHRRARAGLGYLSEERSVFMSMTVTENLRVAGVTPSAAYQFFPELEKLAHRRTGLLSGGEQQMLALAAVLARKPKLLLADELSLGLAPMVVERLLLAVRAAADNGAGVLLVEQHVSSALRFADYVYVLRRGQIVLEGDAADIRSRPGDLEAAYLSADQADAGDVSLFVEAATPADGV